MNKWIKNKGQKPDCRLVDIRFKPELNSDLPSVCLNESPGDWDWRLYNDFGQIDFYRVVA